MEPVAAILSILGALVIGAMSPGPSFVVVARTAVAVSRRDGLAVALGIGVGGIAYGGLALLGLHALLLQLEELYLGIKLLGGLYLLYLAVRLWRAAPEPLATPEPAVRQAPGFGRSFGVGLATHLSNPKTAIVYGSVFAALLPPDMPAWTWAALLPLIFLVEVGWYGIVAVAFSAGRPRAAYLRSKTWIDRLAGSVMGALGARLVVEAGRSG